MGQNDLRKAYQMKKRRRTIIIEGKLFLQVYATQVRTAVGNNFTMEIVRIAAIIVVSIGHRRSSANAVYTLQTIFSQKQNRRSRIIIYNRQLFGREPIQKPIYSSPCVTSLPRPEQLTGQANNKENTYLSHFYIKTSTYVQT